MNKTVKFEIGIEGDIPDSIYGVFNADIELTDDEYRQVLDAVVHSFTLFYINLQTSAIFEPSDGGAEVLGERTSQNILFRRVRALARALFFSPAAVISRQSCGELREMALLALPRITATH